MEKKRQKLAYKMSLFPKIAHLMRFYAKKIVPLHRIIE